MSTTAVHYEPRSTWRPLHTVAMTVLLAAIAVLGISLPAKIDELAFLGQSSLFAWLAIALLMTGVAVVAGHGITGLFRGVLIDDRNRLSLSRLQMMLWTVLILSAYLAAALANIGRDASSPLNVGVPSELWIAMGISTASLVAAPAALAYKQSHDLPFPVYLDTTGVANRNRVGGIPHLVVIDRSGQIRLVHVGGSGLGALESRLGELIPELLAD